MHFVIAHEKTKRVDLAAGFRACWNAISGEISYFHSNGMQLDFVRDRPDETMLAGKGDEAGFENVAILAANLYNLNIQDVPGENAIVFVAK